MLDIALIGTGGMMPTPKRFLASAIIRYKGTSILIDCGEGTQIPLQSLGWGFKDINNILFTHYHGDHIGGLPGILWQMMLAGKTEPLNLIGPVGIEILYGLVSVVKRLPFKINLISLRDLDKSFMIDDIEIKTTPLFHGEKCLAYSFEIKRLREFDPIKAKELNIPIQLWNKLQKGHTTFYDGREFIPDMVLGTERKGLKVSYATDCRPSTSLIDFVRDSDLYIGEGMYGSDEDLPKAKEKLHSTFSETATMAKKAGVRELWLTHYSPSLTNPKSFINVAQKIFPNTEIGEDGKQKVLKFQN